MSAVQSCESRILLALALALALPAALAACGGSGDQTPAKDPSSESGDPADAAKRALDAAKVRGELQGSTVYDAAGQAHTCEAPKPSEQCPAQAGEPNIELKDKCSLGGYQVRRCGCGTFCAGNVAEQGSKMYDASGAAKACAKETADCSAPAPSSAFQDACNDKGHRLKVCGCEWLCSGNPSP